RDSLDVQIHLGLRVGQRRTAVNVDRILPNRKCLQRGVARPSRVLRALRRPARSERVGQLRDSENSLTTVPVTLVLADASQQAEIVFLNSSLSALLLEFALDTMPIQN